MFNPLHSISNQELFDKHLCNPRTVALAVIELHLSEGISQSVSIEYVTGPAKIGRVGT